MPCRWEGSADEGLASAAVDAAGRGGSRLGFGRVVVCIGSTHGGGAGLPGCARPAGRSAVALGHALEVAERLRKAIEEHTFYSDEKLISVTISLGVAEYPSHAIVKQFLIEAADAALYSAKHSGRNKVVLAEKQDSKL